MGKFSVPIQALADKAKADLETVARKATLMVFSSVALKSPVDTGRFRANWNVSHGAPTFDTTTSTEQERANLEVQKALTLPIGGVMWMSNGLPYARRLEHGWSKKQAPFGMVKLTVQEFSDYANKAAAETRGA